MLDPLSAEAFSQAYALQQNPNDADRHLRVRFYTEEFQDAKASAAEGRPIFTSVEMCEIRYGDKDNIVQERVKYMSPDPRKRFPVQYARFKAGEKSQSTGTPLREFGRIARSRAKEYEALEIHTVEELAGISDTVAQGIRGSMADRQAARDFLEESKGAAPLAQARAEIEELKAQVRALMEARNGEAEAADEPPRRKPGRPRKNPPPGAQE